MCDACRATGENYVIKNSDSTLYQSQLYQVFREGVAKIVLCRIHDIDLFRIGEFRFLAKNLKLASVIAAQDNSFFSYG